MKPNRKSDQMYLNDIQMAISTIEKYMQNQTLEVFADDPMRQDAVIRQLELVGEAAGKLSKKFKQEYPQFPARSARMLRNFLIHDYDQIDVETIWYTVEKNIPHLKKQLSEVRK